MIDEGPARTEVTGGCTVCGGAVGITEEGSAPVGIEVVSSEIKGKGS